MLKVKTSLTSLSLQSNALGDYGGVAIADALANNTNLTKLDLSNNSLGEGTGIALGRALSINTSLTDLRLNGNNPLGRIGWEAIATAFRINSTVPFLSCTPLPYTPTDVPKMIWDEFHILNERNRKNHRMRTSTLQSLLSQQFEEQSKILRIDDMLRQTSNLKLGLANKK